MADVVVKLELFPADAVLGGSGTTYHDVRVFVLDVGEGDRVHVWRNEQGGPALVFNEPLTGWAGSVRTSFELTTPDLTIFAGLSGGCRCGQKLGDDATFATAMYPGLRRVNTGF